jgi:ADP-heptose:LPS heptosyltransferase
MACIKIPFGIYEQLRIDINNSFKLLKIIVGEAVKCGGHSTVQAENYYEYVKYLEQLNYMLRIKEANPNFTQITNDPYKRHKDDTKVIAWYLPQYYQTEENNKFHGTGFTEWTNAVRSVPLFTGHNQPRLPYDVGFYNLLNIDTFKRQVELAKLYGIYGFCFYYYWFSGIKTMEKPLELFLNHKEIDMPFCLMWATENWTALWDGGNKEMIFEQKLADGDDKKFMDDILPYMKDVRYIKIDGKPVLMFHKRYFEQKRFIVLLNNFRIYAKEAGFPGLYIIISAGDGFTGNVEEWGADAFSENPSVNLGLCDKFPVNGYINPNFKCIAHILDMKNFINEKRFFRKYNSKIVYYSACVNFDNSPRKAFSPNNCVITVNSTPDVYKQWLSDIIQKTKEEHREEENIVFVLAWNEWAEGAVLEPDMFYGYAYLQATKEAIEDTRKIIDENITLNELTNKKKEGINNFCFYIHCIESLGDIVACEPIIRYLKRIEPGSKIVWIIRTNAVEIVKYNPYVDEIVTVENLSESAVIISEKRKESKNVIIDCHHNGRYYGDYIHSNPNNPAVTGVTFLDYGPLLKNFCYCAGLPGLLDAPLFHLSPDAKKPDKMPEKYVVFHCKSSAEYKDWDDNKWNRLAEEIISLGYSVVELGTEAVVKIKNSSYYDCTHISDFQISACIIKDADFFIGIDSLFAHIANCFNVYGILIFSHYFFGFTRPMPYTGNYANGTTASILYAESKQEAREIPFKTVYEEFRRVLSARKDKE